MGSHQEKRLKQGKWYFVGNWGHFVGNWGIYVGNYKIVAKLYCRLTWKDWLVDLLRWSSIILTFTSTIKSRKCFIKIRPMKVEIFDWSIWQYFRSRKFLILEASCSIAQLYFSHKCLWKFKCFRSSELIHTLSPKYLTKSQFTIYLIVFFTYIWVYGTFL